MAIDLKKEQQSTLKRPRYKYSLAARVFFAAINVFTGKKVTPAKAKLIEILASIPYRAWEIRQYGHLTRRYKNEEAVHKACEIMQWSREAQDNEYWHLQVINEKMKEDGLKDPWYLFPVFPFIMVEVYIFLTRLMALVNIRRAFLFNAEFEDHAEHEYAAFVAENPELEKQPVTSEKVKKYADLSNWADVFRRIGLDERDHMNHSFILSGRPEKAVEYEGMPF
jgi:demethoxyubiquinone hydroxylase (CLK1/Coq7/Cat5 family)